MQAIKLTVMGLVAAAMIPVSGFGAEKEPAACCETGIVQACLGCENPADSPVDIRLVSQSASLKDGLHWKVTIKNVSDKPYVLNTCTNMLMCRVLGLHPMLAFDHTGMGLVDICKNKTVSKTPVKISVAPQDEFAFDLIIPPSRIPPEPPSA